MTIQMRILELKGKFLLDNLSSILKEGQLIGFEQGKSEGSAGQALADYDVVYIMSLICHFVS